MMNETPDIDQYWQALQAVLPTFAEDEQRAAVTLYREHSEHRDRIDLAATPVAMDGALMRLSNGRRQTSPRARGVTSDPPAQ